MNRPARSRNLHDWQPKEDDLLLAAAFLDASITVEHLADKLKRDSVCILHRIADSEIPAMVGIEFDPNSEERAEFIGLALSGAPIETALRWCAAQWGDDAEPAPDITAWAGQDMRPGTHLARRIGLWFTSEEQFEALRVLANLPEHEVRQAASAVVERFDAPTPTVVAKQVFGVASAAGSYPWTTASQATAPISLAPMPLRSKRAARGSGSTRVRAKARRTRSSTYPVGAPIVDRRTPADRAWESRTHW